MKENEIQDELTSIRSLMERSSKFISLSGLSGVLAGVYALIGAGLFYYLTNGLTPIDTFPKFDVLVDRMPILISIPIIVLIAAITTAYFLTVKKAKRNGLTVWNPTSRKLLANMIVPLVSGGILMTIMFYQGNIEIVASLSLIFYGLAMYVASNFTFKDVRYLGILEIILGLIAACLPGYGLLFWAIGFGVLHIVYGTIMYLKYDR